MTATIDPPAPPPEAQPAPPPPRRPRSSVPSVRIPRKKIEHTSQGIVVNWVLASFGVLFVWLIAFTLGISSFQHSHYQSVLYAKFRQQLAESTAPLGAHWCIQLVADDGITTTTKCFTTSPGDPIATIDAPSIGLHEVVVEGTAAGQLVRGPGHERDTPFPGQPGTSIVFGRSKLFGGPFHSIATMHPGDVITVTTGEGTARYVVDRIRHKGDQKYTPAPGGSQLTLVTSEGSGWRSVWAPTHVVYVDATMQGTPFVDPGGRVAFGTLPEPEHEMNGDPAALNTLVLWLPLLLLSGAGVVWLYGHWGGWQTWIVGVPVVLASLWGVTETAAQFLPNLM